MKKFLFPYLTAAMSLLNLPAFSQEKANTQAKDDSTVLLGMAGDNLDLYAVLNVFQQSKTIEAFEKSLNDSETKVNNLDLNLDKKVDFIKVTTKKNGDSYQFILQVDVTKTETQDVAVILLDKDKNKKISMQIVGDEELYGKDYVIEPAGNSSVTANPGYVGPDPVTKDVPATTTTVVVQSAPIVQYVYSPAYVPYAPPYYYGYYPPYFAFAATMAIGIYASNHYYHHHGYHGGHYGGGNTVIINDRDNFNNYNSNRNRATTVSDNRARGNYGDGAGTRRGSGASASTRPSAGTSDRGGNRGSGPSASTRPSAGTSDRAGNRGSGPSASTRPSTGTSDRAGVGGASASTRQSPSASTRQSSGGYSSPSSRSSSMGGGRSMGGGGYRGGGGGGGRRR